MFKKEKFSFFKLQLLQITMISNYKFPIIMTTSEHDIVDEFFEPLLKNMNIYYRGVGYFSSQWLKHNVEGLLSFAERNGKIKWITSPILSKEDINCFIIGERAKQDKILKERLEEAVEDLYHALNFDVLTALAWMIADGIIEIRLAIPSGKLSGEFHDKFGYFEDEFGNSLSFNGSNNESSNGVIYNYESFTVFYSWHQNKEISENAEMNKKRFLRLWNNEDENLDIFSIPKAIQEKIVRFRDNSERPYQQYKRNNLGPRVPKNNFKVRDYQKLAYENWVKNDFSGIFAMATGTGKTITSLYCALKEFDLRYIENEKIKFHIIILVPTKTLVEQWTKEVAAFNFYPVITAYSGSKDWKTKIQRIVNDFKFMNLNSSFVIISTYTSFLNHFNNVFSALPKDTLLIADEVHNMGSDSFLKIIDDIKFEKKIGLSATPKRIYSPVSSEQIETFFNSSYPYTFSFSMKEAIDQFILTPYDYNVRFSALTINEFEEYCRITRQLGNPELFDNDIISKNISETNKQKLMKRKRLINGAINKKDTLLEIFQELIKIKEIKYCLVYAPGGSDYFDNHQTDIDQQRIIFLMQSVIKENFRDIKLSSYLGETKDRNKTIQSFENGNIDVLFAINCLDEGVDIPRTEIGIFTASSGNPRQFIQRRGRLLRKHKEKSKATIFDIIVIPPEKFIDKSNFNIARNLVINELKRARYFIELSQHQYSFYSKFDHLLQKYQISLSDVEIDEEFL